MDSEISDLKNSSFTNFNNSIIFGETNRNYRISENDFEKFKLQWISNSYKSLYSNYKKQIHDEIHLIDDTSISGRYFSKLLSYGKQLTNEIKISLMLSGPQKGDVFFNTWLGMNINIPSEELYYIGLPLFATERYTGILRITTFRNQRSKIDDIFENHRNIVYVIELERLNNFAQLISLHLKTNFYLEGYRVLGNIKIGDSNKSKIKRRN
ncbi:MAG: hypothetical protein IPL31_07985 [Saprospiraceae bacterium]|nr:hypothetical protein [Saprospiraceae bacterium]